MKHERSSAFAGRYDPKWDEQRMRFQRKFAGKLAAPLPRRHAPVLNVAIEDRQLADPLELARLTGGQTLAGLVARIDRTHVLTAVRVAKRAASSVALQSP